MVEQPATKTAEVWQTGYSRCHHGVLSMTRAALKSAGYTHYRITGYLDVDDLCPACKEKQPPRTRTRRTLR